MSSNKLGFELEVKANQVIKVFDYLNKELNKIREFLGKPLNVDADASALKQELLDAGQALDSLSDGDVVVSGDASEVVDASEEAQGAVDEVPDNKNVDITGDNKGLLQSLGQIGLALNTVSMAYNKVQSVLGGYISYSHIQEKAEQSLINSMRVKGIATEANIALVMKLAGETQNLTTVGDEESMQLLSMATNMGITTEKMEEALQGSIGLATAFASAGLSRETAMKGIALAMAGEFTQLSRYIPALRTTTDKTEQLAILQKAMADGFELSKAATETGAGALVQYQNLVGDLKEKVGDFINQALTPLIKVLTDVVSFLNDYPGLVKLLISVLGVLAVRIAYLTTKQIALNAAKAVGAALTGNWISLAAAAAVGAGLYGASLLFAEEKQTNFNEAMDEANKGLESQEDRLKRLTDEARAYADALDYATAKKDLQDIGESIDKLYASVGANRDSKVIYFPNDDAEEFYRKLNELEAKEAVLKQKIRDADVQATKDYYQEKERLEYEAGLSGTDLLQYKLSQLQAEYDALGKLDAENVEAKLEIDKQMLVYKKQIAEAEKGILAETEADKAAKEEASRQALIDSLNSKKLEMVQYYANLQQLSAVNYDKMKEDFDEYLVSMKDAFGEESQEYQATRDELKRIQNATHMRMIQEKGSFASRVSALDRDSNLGVLNRYENLMADLKRLYDEDSEEYAEYRKKIGELSSEEVLSAFDGDDGMEGKIKDVKDYFAAYHEMLIASGRSEVEIEKAKQEAISAVRLSQLSSAVAVGAKLMNVYQGQSKAMFSMGKGLSIAQATISGFEAVARAFKDYPWPLNIAVAGIQGALVAAEIKNIKSTKFMPKAESGGLLRGNSHAGGGVVIEAEGGEYITKKSRVAELGSGLFSFLNNAPLEVVKGALAGIQMPTMNIPAVPQVAYANGGQVAGNSVLGDLISEVKLLREEFREKNMTVNNYISANDVIDKADSTKINEKNEDGAFVRSRW